ncbi:MAG: aldolase/citrate lyase family protein [Alphaproteobacteria bacterium]|nr:aldolase/citrate lyase family protein [Alphaproteobacteria bacterium]
MTTIRNVAKERLVAGELAIGIGLRQSRTVDIAKAMKTAGFDWLFLDQEHSMMGLDAAAAISCAAQDAGITPIVRVPGFEHYHAAKALDGGAQGIVVPHVDTPDVAAAMVENCRYPPIGKRSVTGSLPQLDFASVPLGEGSAAVNDATLLVLMIETGEAVKNAAEIAATPGVDVLLVGANDLSMELDIPGELDHPDMVQALEKIVAGCRDAGIYPGLGGIYRQDMIERYVEMGFRMILAGSDLSLMLNAGKESANAIRALPVG